MAFKLEDGTGLVDSNSFVAVNYADGYFLDRNVTDWAGTNDEKQAWLIQATDYICTVFRFRGRKLNPNQALAFPRVGLHVQGMPTNLLKACCEYALRAKSAPLAPDLGSSGAGAAITRKTEKVGPIEETTVYSSSAAATVSTFKSYPAADILLRDMLESYKMVIRA